MMDIEIRVRVRCVGHNFGIQCTERAEVWADARLAAADVCDSIEWIDVPTPDGWTYKGGSGGWERGHYCPQHMP